MGRHATMKVDGAQDDHLRGRHIFHSGTQSTTTVDFQAIRILLELSYRK